MQQVCTALGPVSASPDAPDGGGGLLADVRRLLLEHRDATALSDNISALLGAVQEDMARRGAEAQNALSEW